MVAVDETYGTFPIYVMGQVATPGMVEVEPGTTLLQAIALAGGLDRFAATKRIQLRRTDSTGPGAALSSSTSRPSSAAARSSR